MFSTAILGRLMFVWLWLWLWREHTLRWLGFFFFFFKASADDLRVLLATACGGSAASSESASFAVANFDRGSLGMAGSGHFSPVVSGLLGFGVLF
jgi:hypothetical protein